MEKSTVQLQTVFAIIKTRADASLQALAETPKFIFGLEYIGKAVLKCAFVRRSRMLKRAFLRRSRMPKCMPIF